MNKRAILLATTALALWASPLKAALTETYTFSGLNLAIPDGTPSGLANYQTISSSITAINSLTVTLTISGGWNGDLYCYLSHSSGFAVLLNRVGRTGGDSFGYGDGGFSVTFSDAASTDIHAYQTVSYSLNLAGQLLGTWQPDARHVDPATVLDSSTRTAYLSSFNGLAASGNWTLFLADMSGGDASALNGWSMEITGVPEPVTTALAIFATLAVGSTLARKGLRRRGQTPPSADREPEAN